MVVPCKVDPLHTSHPLVAGLLMLCYHTKHSESSLTGCGQPCPSMHCLRLQLRFLQVAPIKGQLLQLDRRSANRSLCNIWNVLDSIHLLISSIPSLVGLITLIAAA